MIILITGASHTGKTDFTREYLQNIRFICLAMTEDYIEDHFDDIIRYESEVESRIVEADCSIEELKQCNRWFIDAFSDAGDKITLIKDDYEKALKEEGNDAI